MKNLHETKEALLFVISLKNVIWLFFNESAVSIKFKEQS